MLLCAQERISSWSLTVSFVSSKTTTLIVTSGTELNPKAVHGKFSLAVSIVNTGRGHPLVRAFSCSSANGMLRCVQEDVPASK